MTLTKVAIIGSGNIGTARSTGHPRATNVEKH